MNCLFKDEETGLCNHNHNWKCSKDCRKFCDKKLVEQQINRLIKSKMLKNNEHI